MEQGNLEGIRHESRSYTKRCGNIYTSIMYVTETKDTPDTQ